MSNPGRGLNPQNKRLTAQGFSTTGFTLKPVVNPEALSNSDGSPRRHTVSPREPTLSEQQRHSTNEASSPGLSPRPTPNPHLNPNAPTLNRPSKPPPDKISPRNLGTRMLELIGLLLFFIVCIGLFDSNFILMV
jgi:hypothetical protein